MRRLVAAFDLLNLTPCLEEIQMKEVHNPEVRSSSLPPRPRYHSFKDNLESKTPLSFFTVENKRRILLPVRVFQDSAILHSCGFGLTPPRLLATTISRNSQLN